MEEDGGEVRGREGARAAVTPRSPAAPALRDRAAPAASGSRGLAAPNPFAGARTSRISRGAGGTVCGGRRDPAASGATPRTRPPPPRLIDAPVPERGRARGACLADAGTGSTNSACGSSGAREALPSPTTPRGGCGRARCVFFGEEARSPAKVSGEGRRRRRRSTSRSSRQPLRAPSAAPRLAATRRLESAESRVGRHGTRGRWSWSWSQLTAARGAQIRPEVTGERAPSRPPKTRGVEPPGRGSPSSATYSEDASLALPRCAACFLGAFSYHTAFYHLLT
ncbi:nematocyst expressed protein 3-like [Schistocerca serialis cubense]|uniref:nematocyst expressed protein 3-like n=1 Tax=Schistocerca serialis cubense TaxID=2023355 RepID=UPI00214EC9C2|nr:nematocyst expressed protein 3-like [Schistocerca serialis cubense]